MDAARRCCMRAFFYNGALTLTMGSAIPDLKVWPQLQGRRLVFAGPSGRQSDSGLCQQLGTAVPGSAKIRHAAVEAGIHGVTKCGRF